MARKPKVKTEWNGPQVVKAVQQALTLGGRASALGRAGAAVESTAKRSMRTGGRTIGPRGGQKQIPSSPGSPPHVQTGNLRGSITWAFAKMGLSVIVGPSKGAAYGRIHEYGGAKHPPRPFMRPALRKARNRYAKFFRNLPLARTRAGAKLRRRK